jgi:hypothetical protein
MKRHRKLVLASLAAVLAVTCFTVSWWNPWGSAAAPAKSSAIAWRQEAPTTTVTDSEEIFKRAFWRRPSSEDEILHAERHEWRDGDGLQRWQWFLVVKASAQLIKDLRDDNAFGLVPGSESSLNPEAPNWFVFKPGDFSVFRSPHSGMRLMFSKTDSTLYATDSGRGFTKGAPEPVKPAAPVSASGRLPTTPPAHSKP